VRSADGGTLFLDEFEELPAPAQAKLLRVLQESEVTPVGATKPVAVDLRVVVATHRGLESLVASGVLRADLLARVNGFPLALPPLRERREDLGLLIASLLRRHAPGRAVAFTPDAARALLRYRWPLNIRELEKALTVALALSENGKIALASLPLPVRAGDADAPPPREPPAQAGPLSPEDETLRARLVQLLQETSGNVSAVAKAMGKHRTQVQRWLKRFALDPDAFRR
jgi:transcriptional regulator of acetoin/glycerol metabolism